MARRFLSLAVLAIAGTCLLGLGASPASAQQELCPSDNPVVQENNCMGQGSSGWVLNNYSGDIAGFATKSSTNRGENVTLKIGRQSIATDSNVRVDVYRMGYYGNMGGRLITAASSTSVAVNNLFTSCPATNQTTGLKSCSNWANSYTINGAALPASGVYQAKITGTVSGIENTILFTVRDDARNPKSEILYTVPTANYEAYNNWGGKSLYFDTGGGGGENTIAGTPRAVKVSFDRPMEDPRQNNRFIGPDFYMVQWLEKQGYDVNYTEDVSVSQNPAQLLGHKALVLAGHSEYWTQEQFNGFLAARDAGVNIAGFTSNTAYWKVRLESSGRTLVCYKTAEGSGSTGDGEDGANDWGPDGVHGTADDALGLDQIAGTADDHVENSTTTWRDNGAPNGDPNAPPGGRVGPNKPENMLWGNMYYGAELQAGAYPLTVPAGNAQGHYASDRIWRNTGVPTGGTTTIGSNLVGWEWDAIPTQSQYLAKQPAGVKPLTNSTIPLGQNVDWLQDEGRIYAKTPSPGQCACAQAVKYTAVSGALVFAAGTNDWANGLAPSPDDRIIQATYNILSDMGVQPGTAVGLTIDPPSGPQPPTASFTISPNPAQANQTVTFDASSSSDLDGGITKYEWDFNGDGTYEVDAGTNPVTTKSFATTGVYTVRLRVTDEQGVRSTTNRALSIDNSGNGSYPSRVLGTTGLLSYWRMGDTSGNVLTDSYGNSNATTSGAPTLNASGAIGGDTDGAVSFDGSDDAATANLSLSTTSKVTVEFWMKWDGFTNDDDLAMEFTSNFNAVAGGFLIDPNAPQSGGKFGVAIGNGSARNNVYFDRPSAGKWHHYAIVMDTAAAAADQIKPYIDGHLVAFTKTDSGTGAGNFANSSLYFMSRGAGSLFGAGDLDEVAVYTRALDAATVAAHYAGNPLSPTASFEPSANPVNVGQSVTFNGSASSSPNGTITKYEWDLDGNGSYETNTGTTPTASKSYAAAGTVSVGLKVTDSAGQTATTTNGISVEQAGTGTYSSRVLGTAGLTNFWRMGDASGSTLADSKGSSPATISGGPSFGAPGAVSGDPDTAVSFNGTSSAATANLNLSGTSKLTLEFWMKWDAFANDDDLAFEFTPNFNSNSGGFLVDPNAPENGGQFGVGIGSGFSRNTAYFARPTAGAWHHYALVMDSTADAADQIKPYVDGQPIAFNKTASGTGAGNFANSQLYFMSRAASALFASGDLDEVAVFNRALPAATIAQHFGGNIQSPTAAFTSSPNPAQAGQTVTFNASGSTDPDGTITKYEWDLDGNGTYETNTGTTPSATKVYSSGGGVDVKLRVTDNDGNTGQVNHTVTIEASGSGSYASRITSTAGLTNYWRMGDASGTSLVDSKGGANATTVGTPTLGADGALTGDPDKAVSFSGADAAQANVNLSGTSKLTLEFWMKWDAFADDDDLAFELTPNFNSNPGGFLVDPNAPENGGQFAVGIGAGDSRNTAYFARPSAGAWHHYALVLDSTAAPDSQVIPYVDGQPVPYTKTKSGTGAGNFANSTLYFMSRAASALMASGDLDEVALYDRALSATTIDDHFSGSTSGPGQPPAASFTATPSTVQTAQNVVLDGSASADPDGQITKYQWDLDGNGSFETDTGTTATTTKSYATSGSVDVRLQVTDNDGNQSRTVRTVTVTNRPPTSSFTATPSSINTGGTVNFNGSASADPDGTITKYEWDLDGNGTFETDTGTTATTSRAYPTAGSYDVKLRVTDDKGATTTSNKTVTVASQPPTASFTATPNPVDTGATVTYNGSASTDPDGTIAKYEWDLDGNGSFETDTGTTATTTKSYAAAGTVDVKLRVTDNNGQTATTNRSVTVNNRPPTASFTLTPSPANTRQTVTLNGSGSTDPDGTIAKYEWDLDGNGTYEVNTNATPTTTRTFTATGTPTMGLRVTDSNGATATTTRQLTVNSAYRAAVLGTTGISDLWRLDETTGTSAVDANGANNNGTYTGATSVAPLISGETNSFARQFNGTSNYIDASPTPFGTPTTLSAEAWVRTSAQKSSGGYHFLISDSDDDFNNGFSLAIDSSNRPTFVVAREGFLGIVTRGQATSSTTVAPNTTHHIVGTYDGSRARIYVDGVERANVSFSNGPTWPSGRDLRIGRPISNTSLAQRYLQGQLDEPAIYTSALSATTVQAHYDAGKP